MANSIQRLVILVLAISIVIGIAHTINDANSTTQTHLAYSESVSTIGYEDIENMEPAIETEGRDQTNDAISSIDAGRFFINTLTKGLYPLAGFFNNNDFKEPELNLIMQIIQIFKFLIEAVLGIEIYLAIVNKKTT